MSEPTLHSLEKCDEVLLRSMEAIRIDQNQVGLRFSPTLAIDRFAQEATQADFSTPEAIKAYVDDLPQLTWHDGFGELADRALQRFHRELLFDRGILDATTDITDPTPGGGQGTPIEEGDHRDATAAVAKAASAAPRRRFIFPTFTPGQDGVGHGGLFDASVWVLPADGWPYEEPVAIAPWSRIEAVDQDFKDLSEVSAEEETLDDLLGIGLGELQRSLPAALRDSGLTESDRLRFLIDLRPLRSIDHTSSESLDRRLWELTPRQPIVQGRSLGLAIGLAALAASERLSLAYGVASGELRTGGRIGRIAGLTRGKLLAWKALCEVRGGKLPFLAPAANESESEQDAGLTADEACELTLVDALSEARKHLADGFDQLRWKLHAAAEAHAANRSSDLEAGPEDAGLETLAETLSSTAITEVSAAPGGLPTYTTPFASPAPLIRGVSDRLTSAALEPWLRTPETERGVFVDRPVVLPFSVADMLLEVVDAPLATRIAAAVNERCGPGCVSADDVAIALERPGKLILICEDFSSEELFGVPKDPWEARLRVWDELRELAEGGGQRAPQTVVAVCSDVHHERLWRGVPTGAINA